MDSKLISYSGIDDFEEIYSFDKQLPYKLEGSIKFDFEIDKVLSFGLNKDYIDYKIIDIFDNTNCEDENFYGNLVIINNKFDLDFEYSLKNAKTTLNMHSHKIHTANKISIEDFDYSDLEINLLTKDLFCTLVNSNEIYYCANLIIGIQIL